MTRAKGSTARRVYAGAASWLAFGPMSAPRVIGVVGAGTMGAGIAQLGALAGGRTGGRGQRPPRGAVGGPAAAVRRRRGRRRARARADPGPARARRGEGPL